MDLNPDPTTLFIEDVDRIDSAFFDPERGICGGSWHVDIAVSGPFDDNGFIYDFGPLKKAVREVLKGRIDHVLFVPVLAPGVTVRQGQVGPVHQLRTRDGEHWEYEGPEGSVRPVRATEITRPLLEEECTRLLQAWMARPELHLTVRLREERGTDESVFFRYTHGIQGHAGLCQRLFHGHRGLLRINLDDEERPDKARELVRNLFGDRSIHVATREQLTGEDAGGGSQLAFSASLGRYRGIVPRERLLFTEGSTCIEFLAGHIGRILATREPPGTRISVACYEGIGKGACFTTVAG